MELFRKRQTGVAVGMATGFALTLTAFLWPQLPPAPEDTDGRFLLWTACSSFVALWLLFAIARLAGHRFFAPQDIDGGGSRANSARAALLQALVQNTLEQVVLAAIAYAAWLWLGPPERGGLIVLCTVYFSVGRLLFFAGYSRGAPFRALGFTLTFYPTVGLYLLLLPRAAERLVIL